MKPSIDDVLGALRQGEEFLARDVSRRLGCAPREVSVFLSTLHQRGHIERIGRETGDHPMRYRVVALPPPEAPPAAEDRRVRRWIVPGRSSEEGLTMHVSLPREPWSEAV